MDSFRYILALLLVVALPPLFSYWLLIHPLIDFWRGKGIGVTYGAVLTIIGVGVVGLFSIRHRLLTIDYGTNYILIVLGVVGIVASGRMHFVLRRHLSLKTLLGLPEIAPDRYPRQLITQGIYSRTRHPRYLELLIALLGYALIANHLASYLATGLWYAGIYLIVVLEERELRAHFGAAYDDYCRKVPRFLPRLWNIFKEG